MESASDDEAEAVSERRVSAAVEVFPSLSCWPDFLVLLEVACGRPLE